MRLFIALDLPEEAIVQLDQFLARLKPLAPIRWSAPDNLHITTKFIGEWPEERLDELKAALAGLPPRGPVGVHIHGAGFFPNAKSPRVFWCGVDAPDLAKLAADTDGATAALGIAKEERAYSPHLTLARIKERVNLGALRAALEKEAPLDFGRFQATSFFLYRSQMRRNGSVYTKLAEFPLTHP